MANQLVRVDEYRYSDGAISPTGHGLRLVPTNITLIYTAGIGSDGHEVFEVTLVGGKVVYTNWSGVEAINGWAQPTQSVS